MVNRLKFFSYENTDHNRDQSSMTNVVPEHGNSVNSFVRELTQNSIDAWKALHGPIIAKGQGPTIKIRTFSMTKDELRSLTDFENFERKLKLIYDKCHDKREGLLKDDIKRFLDSNDVIIVSFEDYNTPGLHGNDNDADSTWYACVRADAASKKSEGTTGEHGIGKNAAFQLSGIRTVFYSSLNTKNEYKFAGLSKLRGYQQDGTHYNREIYYGVSQKENGNNEIKLVADPMLIPTKFRRNEVGLSQFCLGFFGDLEETKTLIIKEFIDNYGPCFAKDSLRVEVDDVCVSSKTLRGLIDKLFDDLADDKLGPKPFIDCYTTTGENIENIFYKEVYEKTHLGKIEIKALRLDENLANNGSARLFRYDAYLPHDFETKQRLSHDFAVTLRCLEQKGNDLLGKLSKPDHKSLSPEWAHKKTGKDLKVFTSAVKELQWVYNKVVRKLAKDIDEPVVDDVFKDMIPGFGPSRQESGKSVSDREAYDRRIRDGVYKLKRNSSKVLVFGELVEGGKKNIKPGPRPRTNPGPRLGPNPRAKPRTNRTEIVPEMFESSSSNSETSTSTWTLVLESKKRVFCKRIEIRQLNESRRGNFMTSEILEVTDAKGETVEFYPETNKDGDLTHYTIRNIHVSKGIPIVFSLKVKRGLAFKAIVKHK